MNFLKLLFFGDRTPAYSNELPAQFRLMARLIVGAYVLYLAYGLKDAVKNAENSFKAGGFTIAIVCFAICGGYLLYTSLRDYAIGRYVGGKLDLGENPADITADDEAIASNVYDAVEAKNSEKTE